MRTRIIFCIAVLAAALGLAVTATGPAGAATSRSGGSSAAALTTTSTTTAKTPDTNLPPIRHVFVIVLENESAAKTFPTSGPAPAPYLADTMRAQGAFLPNYYGTGHNSNDNYISMISGQAPNAQNQNDCLIFDDFLTSGVGADGQQQGTGCVYPSDIPTIASQLDAKGLTWKSYNEDMGNDPTREAATCGHPAVNRPDNTQEQETGDAYATRHNPFVYFHSIIDNASLCASHVVNLTQLASDLKSPATTPNYVFITPNLCHDGHDATCKTAGEHGGFAGINDFLAKWVPLITHSPAYTQENGLLITTFDEVGASDTSACCGEIPGPGSAKPGITGPGGGKVGAVLMSPCIAPGTVSDVAYNHYAMLGSVENLFGLARLGYAQLPGESYFGADVFTNAGACSGPPQASFSAHGPRRAYARTAAVSLRFSSSSPGAAFTVQARQWRPTRTAWRTVGGPRSQGAVTFPGVAGHTYQFRVRATNRLGRTGRWVVRTVRIPSRSARRA